MNFILDLIASTSFYLVPLFVGSLAMAKFPRVRSLSTIFASGAVLTYLFIGLMLYFANIFDLRENALSLIQYISFALPAIGLIVLALSTRRHNLINLLVTYRSSKNDIYAYSGLLLFTAFIYFFIWKSFTPYPYSLNWDAYEHITAANNIASGDFSFLPSHISDTFTFDGYTSLFQTLLSLPKILFKTNLVGVYWWIEYWHYLITTLVVYSVTKFFFKDRWIAFISGLISSLIFESSIVYSTLFLIPQTFTAVLAVGAIPSLVKTYEEDRLLVYQIISFVIIGIFLVISHFIIGGAAVLALLAYLILLSKKLSRKASLALFGISILALLGSIGFGFSNDMVLTDREEAAHFTLSLREKLEPFFNWYSFSLPILLPFGAYAIYKENKSKSLNLLPILAILVLAISVAPFSYFLKFYVLGRYFVHILMVAGLAYLLRNTNRIQSTIFGLWFVLAFFAVFYFNQLAYTSYLYYQGRYSHISQTELKTASWLSRKYDKDSTLIISDPSTQYILEGLSGVNSQGGAYTTLETRKILADVNNLTNTEEIRQKLLTIKDNNLPTQKRLLILSGRYFSWQAFPEDRKQSFFYNIWTPREVDMSNYSLINSLSSDPNFNIVYQNSELVIFEF